MLVKFLIIVTLYYSGSDITQMEYELDWRSYTIGQEFCHQPHIQKSLLKKLAIFAVEHPEPLHGNLPSGAIVRCINTQDTRND